MNIIFGPVNSRRFGVSLGIDLSPEFKQCNFDCLYCELVPAEPLSEQKSTVSVNSIINELKTALGKHNNIADITITANGEPTLYPYLYELIEHIDEIKGNTKTLILSNSAALVNPALFSTLLKLDQVKLSLDAVTPETFKKIDRPAPGIDIYAIIEAIQKFADEFSGDLYLEILFVHDVNDSDADIAALNEVIESIPCKRIDIGTIDRPPAYKVQGLSYSELHSVASKFDPALPIHIASRTHAESCQSRYSDSEIINTLDKRPLSMEDMELLFDRETQKRLHTLVKNGRITTSTASGVEFYMPAENIGRKRLKRS